MIDLNALPALLPPFEIAELEPGVTYKYTVAGYDIGTMTIMPRHEAAGKEKKIVAVRLHVPKEEKPAFPHYWDFTPARLVYQLIGILTQQNIIGRQIAIERDLPGRQAHFSVQVL